LWARHRNCRFSADVGPPRANVVKLEPAGLTAPAIGPDENAPAFVARPHLTPDRRRDVTPRGSRHASRPRATRAGAPRALELVDQHRQGAVDDDSRVARRHDVTQQVAGAVEPGPRLGAQRDPEQVPIRGERSDNRARRRGGSGSARGSTFLPPGRR
jgi:hypothetical protein